MLFEKTTLGDVSKGGKGNYGIAASAVDYSDEFYTYLRITDIKDDGTIDFGGLKSVNDGKAANYLLQPNDIVFARTGASTGRNYFYDGSDGQFVYAGFLIKFSIDPDKVNPKYVKYYCLSQEYKGWIASYNTGSTRGNINAQTLAQMPLLLPERMQQDKMVDILSSIDRKIKENEKINKNLLEQALAIYKDWFCDYALSDGILPENWKITTIEAISSLVTRGIAPKYDDSSAQIVLNQKCIRDHTIDISLSRRHLPKKINEKWISKGDLLINSTGTGTLGRVAQVWFEANNMTVDSHVTIVRPKDPILQSYIGFWGLSHENEIEAQHTGSTGQTELPRDRVKAMELPLPDEDTLSKFNELVIPMTSTVISNQEENARLSQLRDALLPKLMSGELDVSDIDL